VKKGMCYGSLPPKLSPKDRLQLAKDAGLDGVEIPAFGSQGETENVASLAEEAGVEIHSVMAGSHWQLPLSSTDEAVRLKGVEGIKHSLNVAKWAGTSVVLVVPGVVTADDSYEAVYDLSRKSMRELIPTAEKLGVTMAVENVWNKFLLSPMEMRDYIDSFHHPLVQAYFDVGNILLYGYPHHYVETLGKRIKKVHIKDFNASQRQFVPVLSGDVDFPRFINALNGLGYSDYLTAELPPYPQFPVQLVYDTSAHLDCIIGA